MILDVVYNHVGPGDEALTRVRRRTSPTGTRRSGATRSTTRSAACASGRSRTPSSGCATTTSTGCGSTRRTRSSTTRRSTSAPSSPSACTRRARRARHLGDGGRRLAADRGVGPRRAVGRRAPPRAARPPHRRARRLLRGLRLRRRARARTSHGAGHDPRRLVVCAQNHDQVGNRAARRPAAAEDALRVAAAVTLFSPCTPLLFMGEEYVETAPFQFFTDHIDPAIAEATREGRRREFATFAAFAGEEVPDPQARRDVPPLEAPSARARPALPRAARAAPRAAARARDARPTRRRSVLRAAARRGELVADFAQPARGDSPA